MTQHVVLIGAARSGTKILRDVLALATGIGAVPYDIPFVWRDGHPRAADDRLDPTRLTASRRAFITRYVDRYAAGHPPAVIEKTVGNALRVPYVSAVLPDARFVHLVRDGLDVVESTLRQWNAPSDYRYLARKARHFPLRKLPTYGVAFVRDQTRRSGHVSSWGVRYPGMVDDVAGHDLLTVCSRQWRRCVETATADFADLGIEPVEVRYERLVTEPVETLRDLCASLGLASTDDDMLQAAASVRGDRRGAGTLGLDADQRDQIEREIGDLRRRWGFTSTDGAPE